MVSKDEVKHIAQLARLGISPEEEEKFSHDLSEILDYMKKLQKINLNDVTPTSHSLSSENVFREDEVKVTSPDVVNHLINLSPSQKGRYIKVKPIFKEPSN